LGVSRVVVGHWLGGRGIRVRNTLQATVHARLGFGMTVPSGGGGATTDSGLVSCAENFGD